MKARRVLTRDDLLINGYLLEANRQFFHPLGLALAVEDNGNLLIFDDRDYPEGNIFGTSPVMHQQMLESYERFRAIEKQRKKDRRAHYGIWIQGIGLCDEKGAERLEQGEFKLPDSE